MGASDSKIIFKRGIFRLSEERDIPANDDYWTSFWELPESSEDVFSLFSPADIRRSRDQALENIETLILVLTSRLFVLRHHPSFPDNELAPEREALNCVRVLTRILPYLYEKESLHPWEEKFFWGARKRRTRHGAIANEVLFDESTGDKEHVEADKELFEDVKPLAEELLDTLLDMLFFSEFTIPKQQPGRPKVTYAIWQSGVGCNTAVATTKEFESNRCELLRLILALAGRGLYMSSPALTQSGVRTLTHLCTNPDKQVVLSLLCSLLNTTLKYHPASWRVPYNSLVIRDTKQLLVTQSLHLLLAVLVYTVPEHIEASSRKNYYRHFLGRLHRPQDFQFIVDGVSRILTQPLQDKTSYLPGAHTSVNLSAEMLMLFWEMIQCNKRFRAFVIDTDRAHDFIVLTLFYAVEYKNEPAKQGIVRMCAFLLQTMSVEKNFGLHLNQKFVGQESLPPGIRINAFDGSYADFLIHSIYTLITTSQGGLTAIYPALLAIINNIAPYIENLGASGSSQLMHLFALMSSPSFLLANETNHTLLRSLLESINTIIEHKYKENAQLVAAVFKNKKPIESLRTFTLESGLQEMERRNRRRKDAGRDVDATNIGSRRTSVDSLEPTRSPVIGQTHALEEVVEDTAFAIGDDDDSDDEPQATPAASTTSENQSQTSLTPNVDDSVPVQLRGMSEKARGKLPAGIRSFSRQNSTTSLGGYSVGGQSGSGSFQPSSYWIESWLPELPLHTFLVVIQQVSSLLPRKAGQDIFSAESMQRIRELDLVGVEASQVKVQSFEWSPLSLGWYESMLWGVVYASEMQIAKGTSGIWTGTGVKLFRIQETAPTGPTLSSPRGAVDAVGSNIVSRIGQINLRGGAGSTGSAAGGNAPQ
ncbi:High-temperature-induced dauer-formation protein-like protein [Cordyceps militaris CM01]|uniref:High-temperature-induced dauer-formation protein-like protein n=1 Tax=Cordyceps militaris (strain CM01) TaxID=983644 RepID=G3J9I4_CORMM|nr:High-temperature-induced dauer-formation protein-like protein [Cordyceps militaris CM01]EGX94961.1 High-temperature-induced dauer-formation protein-like protein [Cordyceps militaris CM01]